jgi:hypothetical protein
MRSRSFCALNDRLDIDERIIDRAAAHIRYLSVEIGGRGSCTPNERRAAEYAAAQMGQIGVGQVRVEPFRGAPSSYRPYAAAFAAALLGTAAAWLGAPRGFAAAALLNALGAWAMLAETDLASNWTRLILPTAGSCNAVGVMPPGGLPRGGPLPAGLLQDGPDDRPHGEVVHKVVLCAHIDSHRTPVFYSSPVWNRLFTPLIGGAWLSMVLAALVYAWGSASAWGSAAIPQAVAEGGWVRWAGLAASALPLFALLLCLHADATPYSPGANDNASGVGVLLGAAQRLIAQPLQQTEVWLAFTGCEEVGGYGMRAFLEAHAGELGSEAVYLIADQVGIGRLTVINREGLVIKRQAHPRALELGRQVIARRPDLGAAEGAGLAYTDALLATKGGGIAISLVANPPPGSGETSRWHQMTDTPGHIDRQALGAAHAFIWELLQVVDAG